MEQPLLPQRRGKQPKRTTRGRSHGGCVVCKERHIKCDETRPTCRRCLRAHRRCVYQNTEELSGAAYRDVDSNESSPSDDSLVVAGYYRSPHMMQGDFKLQNYMTTNMQFLDTAYRVISTRGVIEGTRLSLHMGDWVHDVPDLLVPHILRSSAARNAILAAGMCTNYDDSELDYYSNSLQLSRIELLTADGSQESVLLQLITILFLAITCLFRVDEHEFGIHCHAGVCISQEYLQTLTPADVVMDELRAVLDLILRFWSIASWPSTCEARTLEGTPALLLCIEDAAADAMRLPNELMRLGLVDATRYELCQAIAEAKGWMLVLLSGIIDSSDEVNWNVMRERFWSFNSKFRACIEVYARMTKVTRDAMLSSPGDNRIKSAYECTLQAYFWSGCVVVKSFWVAIHYELLTLAETEKDFASSIREVCLIVCEIKSLTSPTDKMTIPICLLITYVSEIVRQAFEGGLDLSEGDQDFGMVLEEVMDMLHECKSTVGMEIFERIERGRFGWNNGWPLKIPDTRDLLKFR